ncbi:transcriptional regulatory protein [Paramyrothecium foliicola]|nr:transcriptional regulatory protein [Paramyrothecium foliicola]
MFEARCQQLDVFCNRLENLASQLTNALEALQKVKAASPTTSAADDLHQAARTLQSLPLPIDHQMDPMPTADIDNDLPPTTDGPGHATNSLGDGGDSSDNDEFEDDDLIEREQEDGTTTIQQATTGRLGSLVTDSYGRLRFIGGATNSMLVEAVQSLTPGQSLDSESPATGDTVASNRTKSIHPPIEIPLFVHGQQWRALPHLPKPEELGLPPHYIADMLVGFYFDQFHYTFPVLYKPHFIAQFKQLKSINKAEKTLDKRFLSVFFAVCACSASLMPSESSSSKFSGIEYYEKALLMHFTMVGEASIERVQCLALLAMCCAGWNTLSTSWNFAGQAVRAAQDLGLHLSGLMPGYDSPAKGSPSSSLKREISQRVWWSIYCLDRVISICLGRPLAAHDADCRSELPLAVADDELEHACAHPESLRNRPASALPLSGFLAFARLCRISGKIQRLHSPSRIADSTKPEKVAQLTRAVAAVDKSLNDWLNDLPDEIRFSANHLDRGPNLTMCVIMFIVHAGSLLNLYRAICAESNGMLIDMNPLPQCISAARSCINAAELVREVVPPSHHLAFCVHYLTLSGLMLVRMQDQATARADPDIKKCTQFLKDLEPIWSGASRARTIIEQLLNNPRHSFNDSIARWETFEGSPMLQLPRSDALDLELYAMDFPSTWGWLST